MRLKGYVFTQVGSIENDPLLDVVHGVILHVTGTNDSPLEYFDGPSKGIESHAYIPKSDLNDKEQYRDTRREADANYKANSWIEGGKRHGFISVETQGLGSGKWTNYQLDSIKDLILQTQAEHKYPLQVPQSYHGWGVGYHIMYPEWTNVSGKICPGPERIKQYNSIIVPWMQEMRDAHSKKYYTVKIGDTVPSISEKFKVPQWQLWRWNPDVNPPFAPGTRLRVG